jgi:hypothetical protein
MRKFFRFLLSSGRKRRRQLVGVIVWLLRQLRDIEENEFGRYEDILDSLEWDFDIMSRNEYVAAEEEYASCENVLGFLESAIDDLDSAYYDLGPAF